MIDIEEKLYANALDIWGEKAQLTVAIEELAELQQAISKVIREKPDWENLAEEVADVEIMIEQLRRMYPKLDDRAHRWRAAKMDRLAKMIRDHQGEGSEED